MEKKFEILAVYTDPFDIMCGEGPEHEIEVWEDTTLEALKQDHEMYLAMEQSDPMFNEMGQEPTPEDFDEFIADMLRHGHLREKVADSSLHSINQ